MRKTITMAMASYSLTVFVGPEEYTRFRKRFMVVTGKSIPDVPHDENGNTVGGLACLQNIWIQELKASLLAHEALHAIEILHTHIGITISPGSVDELKAYQLQYVLESFGF